MLYQKLPTIEKTFYIGLPAMSPLENFYALRFFSHSTYKVVEGRTKKSLTW